MEEFGCWECFSFLMRQHHDTHYGPVHAENIGKAMKEIKIICSGAVFCFHIPNYTEKNLHCMDCNEFLMCLFWMREACRDRKWSSSERVNLTNDVAVQLQNFPLYIMMNIFGVKFLLLSCWCFYLFPPVYMSTISKPFTITVMVVISHNVYLQRS